MNFQNSAETAKKEMSPQEHYRRWNRLCERYLPIKAGDSFWRTNRQPKPQEPMQGWKLHISATILEACDLFERVAPLLLAEDVQFKAPNSLVDLFRINCGLHYGYRQIGKFITVYPPNEKRALKLAKKLHRITKEFTPISVPFDNQYAPESSVFYRYGAFSLIEAEDEKGSKIPVLENKEGHLVPDDRNRAVPDWISDPFPVQNELKKKSFAGTPLGTTYRIFQAITQRGKGGTYRAIDLSQENPRLCIIKEGRRNGEIAWNGQDGYQLVQNEFGVLSTLRKNYQDVPQVFSSFEIHGNLYFAMEFVEGKSLDELIKTRRRRLPVRKVIEFAVAIAKIIEKIHGAGWVWNDCKPLNLIVTKKNELKPIDFEGAYRIGAKEPFEWKSKGFSTIAEGTASDTYALGAVVYFLLTGRFYNVEEPLPIKKFRRKIPADLIAVILKLLSAKVSDISPVRKELERILASIDL